MKKIVILTMGTRGDVQPYISIGTFYQQRGYDVTICTGQSFRQLVESAQLHFASVALDLMALVETAEGKQVMEAPLTHPIRTWNYTNTIVKPGYRQSFTDFWQAAQNADILFYHPKVVCAIDIAEKLAIPAFLVSPVPMMYPIAEFPNLAVTTKNLGATLNRLTYKPNQLADQAFMKEINDFRQSCLALPPRKSGKYANSRENGAPIPIIYPISSSLFPDVTSWQSHVTLAGFFPVADQEQQLPAEVIKFCQQGSAPIVVTFSSMPLQNPKRFAEILVAYAQKTNERFIILSGASGLEMTTNEQFFVTEALPHEVLFAQAKLVIHHGGIGTLAHVLRAGKPQLIFPQAVDQPFWAKRMVTLGVTPPTPKITKVTIEQFEQLVTAALTLQKNDQIQRLQQQLGDEQPIDFVIAYENQLP